MLHRFRDITTFTVYVTACDLEKSFRFNTRVEFTTVLFDSHIYIILYFYTTVIRRIVEYASPLWHPTLTKSQGERLEAFQCRAINIIFCYSSPTSYFSTLAEAGFPSLQARRSDHSKLFYQKQFANPIAVFTIFSHHLKIQP